MLKQWEVEAFIIPVLLAEFYSRRSEGNILV